MNFDETPPKKASSEFDVGYQSEKKERKHQRPGVYNVRTDHKLETKIRNEYLGRLCYVYCNVLFI